jgi:two-component system, NtrC family, sensor histidine kinase KinB
MFPLRLADLTLRRKILGGYAVITVLLLLVCAWSIFNLARLGQASEAILHENYRSILAAQSMVAAVERQDSNVLSLLWGHGDTARAEFRANEVEFLTWLSRAQDNITLAGEAETLSTIQTVYVAYLESFAELSRLQETEPALVSDFYLETLFPLFQQVRDTCNQLRDVNQNEMVAASERARLISERAIWSMILIGVGTAALGLVFGLVLSDHLTRPLKEMAVVTDRIAAGDYDVSLSSDSADEVGHLAGKIMAMSRTLKRFHELNVGKLLAEKQRNETIIQNIDDGVMLVDEHSNIVTINPMAATIFHTSRDEATGCHLFDVVQNQRVYDVARQVLASGRATDLRDEEATLSLPDGNRVATYRFSVTPVHLHSGGVSNAVLLFQDITHLTEVDRLKSEFVMTASHELRTPLTSIAMSIELLAEQALPRLKEPERELLQAAQEEITRLRALINDLLDLSKIESGRIEMEIEPVRVLFLVDEAVNLLAQQAEQKGIELKGEVGSPSATVLADPNKIVWVLTNLVANALRYTPAGGHVKVQSHSNGNMTYISVIDDGEGIPLEYQSQIFDKFVQVKGRQATGSGLGLAISKEIVKAHQGTIWVKSSPGEGSVFTFALPNAAVEMPDPHGGEYDKATSPDRR